MMGFFGGGGAPPRFYVLPIFNSYSFHAFFHFIIDNTSRLNAFFHGLTHASISLPVAFVLHLEVFPCGVPYHAICTCHELSNDAAKSRADSFRDGGFRLAGLSR